MFSFHTLMLALFEADSWCSESAFNLNLTRENSKISWRKKTQKLSFIVSSVCLLGCNLR